MPSRIEIREIDITSLSVDAIVNGAHPTLMPATTEEQTLHALAGPKLSEECKHVAPCPVGEARITRGYDLLANFVIHAAGPAWGGGEADEDVYLRQCYKNSFDIGKSFNIKTIAFPCISTGQNGFPAQRAAFIAMQEILLYLEAHPDFKSVVLACKSEKEVWEYESAFDRCGGKNAK